jgi:predicted nucleic acid-binding protein
MAEGEACLLDSNILMRISKGDDPQHPVITQALKALVGQGVRLCYTSQTLAEFWNAATRPLDKNGFGLTVAETDRLAHVIERDFELLPDSRETHERWRALLVAHNVLGVQVHDTRLAASMYVHGIGQLLTINVRDFKRFDGLRVMHPADVPKTKAEP